MSLDPVEPTLADPRDFVIDGWRMAPGSEPQRVLDDHWHFNRGNWQVHRLGVFYIRFGGSGAELCRYDYRSGEVTAVTPIREFSNPGLAFGPDGGRAFHPSRTG